MPSHPARESLNIRIQPGLRGLIDRAAELQGKTRTDFVLDASRRAAEEALVDRSLFEAGADAYRAFLARLDEAPRPSDRLRRTMTAPAPWDDA